jgi:signal transduction histidine kinase
VYDLAKGGVLDGLITWKGHLTEYLNDAETADFCRQYDVPIVTIEGAVPGHPCITYDNYSGMRMAVDHLIDVHGFTRIGYVGLVSKHTGFEERHRAYCDSLKAHGIPIETALLMPLSKWDLANEGSIAEDPVDAWLRDSCRSGLQAIVGSCDPNATWIMDKLEKQGIDVPEHVSVVGFDGFMLGEAAVPRLTTVKPSWADLGSSALDALIRIIDGETVEQRVVVPIHLVVARSCGCIETNVGRAGGPAPAQDDNTIIEATSALTGESTAENLPGIAGLLETFLEETRHEGQGRFIGQFDAILRKLIKTEMGVVQLQDTVSALHRLSIRELGGNGRLQRAEYLCNQARVLIGNAASQLHIRQRVITEERITREHMIGIKLISAFEVDKIMDLLAEGLPGLGIDGCCISLYENPQPYKYPDPAPQWSRLILAFNAGGRVDLGLDGMRFPSRQIVPDGLSGRDRARNLLVHPLYFRDHQIGFIVYEATLSVGNTYSVLSSQISNGLKGALLVRETMEKDRKLESVLSDLKENQEKLLISEKMGSLGRLTAGIAHEMNTPLAAARASLKELSALVEEYASAVTSPEITVQDHKEIVKEMSNSVALTDKAIEKASGFIRSIKAQTMDMDRQESRVFNAVQVISDALLFINHIATCSNARVEFTHSNESSRLFGPPGRLVQVIINLVTNAMESMEKTKAGVVRIDLREEGEGVTLSVADQGCGIPRENLNRIFEPMFTTKPFGQGTGMGLAIVHDIVYGDFGGTVQVESRIGAGTTFTLTFKSCREKSAP